MPMRQVTVVDGKTVYVDELEDHELFGPGSKWMVDVPQYGWYRRMDGKMVYLPNRIPLDRDRFPGIHFVVSADGHNVVYVPEPQDQPGVPTGNEWLDADQRLAIIHHRRRFR